jgi:hypothetical protein
MKSSTDTELTLVQLRTVVSRVNLIAAEVTEIGMMLKAGSITPAIARQWTEQVAPGCLTVVANDLAPTKTEGP